MSLILAFALAGCGAPDDSAVVEKIVQGNELTKEEQNFYSHHKDRLDSKVEARKSVIANERVITKLVTGEDLTAGESQLYAEKKQYFDGVLAERREKKGEEQHAAATESEKPSPLPSTETETTRKEEKIEEQETDVYFAKILDIPHMKERKK